MKLKILYTVNLATHWAPAIINDDYTGLEDGEDEQLNEWLRANPSAVYECGDEVSFTKDEITGMMADCYEVKLWG